MGDELTRSNGLGALVFVTSYYDIISNGKLLGLTLQAGYKSTGYALGEQLNSGPILRGGLALNLTKGNR